jgi:hypothetical protein
MLKRIFADNFRALVEVMGSTLIAGTNFPFQTSLFLRKDFA